MAVPNGGTASPQRCPELWCAACKSRITTTTCAQAKSPRATGTAILSNKHVAAGENRGVIGDRITQPGAAAHASANQIATLTRFVALQPSARGTTIVDGTVVLNEIDGGWFALCRQSHVDVRVPDRQRHERTQLPTGVNTCHWRRSARSGTGVAHRGRWRNHGSGEVGCRVA